MRVMDRLPRLTQRELEELGQARRKLDAVYDTIAGTNLQAKPAIQAHLVEIAGVLDRVIHKRMDVLAKLRYPESSESPQDAPAEGDAGEAANDLRNVAPAKEEL